MLQSHLDIKDVKVGGKSLKYDTAQQLEPFGRPLSIKLDEGVSLDEMVKVEVCYCHLRLAFPS